MIIQKNLYVSNTISNSNKITFCTIDMSSNIVFLYLNLYVYYHNKIKLYYRFI